MAWRDLDIGAVSAYAIAVEHGYTGTEEEWASEQAAAGENARIAKESAKTAVAAAKAAQSNLDSIKPNTEQAIADIKTEGSTQKSSVTSTGDAQNQRVMDTGAEQSRALSAQGDVEQRKVIAAGDEQVSRVTNAGNDAVESVTLEKTNAINDVQSTKIEAVNSVETAKTSAVEAVKSAESAAIQNIGTGVDDTLSISGKAADAKKTGDSISSLKDDKLDKTGTAADSDKLGGQLPKHYATAQSVNQLKNDVAAITPDDTVVDGKPWTSKKTVDSLCMPLEATGNPVQVYPVEGYPLGVKVSWEPTQAGSGDPSPENIRPISGKKAISVTRCGKNLSQVNAFGSVMWASQNDGINKLVSSLHAGTYRISFTMTITEFTDRFTSETEPADGLYAIIIMFDGSSVKKTVYIGEGQKIYRTDTLPKSASVNTGFVIEEEDVGYRKEVYFYGCGRNNAAEGAPNGTLGIAEVSNLQIELGSTATPYEPYTASTKDITLPETVYGGTLDVETGVVTVDRGITIADGVENQFTPIPSGEYWNMPYYSSPDIIPYNSLQNSHFNIEIFGVNINYEFIFISHEKIAGLFDTVDDLNAYLVEQNAAGTPVTFVYKLATPYTIQLTPQQIAALSGVNTLYTDAGTLTVTGREDPRHTIVTLTDRIAALESAAAGV